MRLELAYLEVVPMVESYEEAAGHTCMKSAQSTLVDVIQSITATKHTGSKGTRNKLSKNKKGRVISLFLAYDRGSIPRPLAYKPVFVPIYYHNLSLSRFIRISYA